MWSLPHDLRRTCAKLCRKNGGRPWSRSSFLLGHASIQTTERYLGSEQDIIVAVQRWIGFLDKDYCVVAAERDK
jgi:integrase